MSKVVIFASTVDASRYLAGFGTAKGAALHSIDYDSGTYRFSLVATDDSVSPVVNGVEVTPANASETTAAADIRAVIAAT